MEIFIARQPILDAEQRVFAYELLFQSGFEIFFEDPPSDYSSSMILNQVLSMGLEKLSQGKKILVIFSEDLLIKEVATTIPKEMMLIGIPENIELEDEVVNALQNLKQSGYLLVFEEFILEAKFEPLLSLADIIKVDFFETVPEEDKARIQAVQNKKIKFLAKNVETIESFNQAKELGYSFFQGNFFLKPDRLMSARDIAGYKLNYLRILNELNQPELDFDRLQEIIKQDVSLPYKLLGYINSAFLGLPNEIRSIKHALSLIGRKEVKKWLSVIALSSMGKEKSEELIFSSLIRAGFCEMVAPKIGLQERASELFLMGLFSRLDAILDQEMSDILTKLPLSEDIKKALLGEQNYLRQLYDLIASFEKGAWEQLREATISLGLQEAELPDMFAKAIEQSNAFAGVNSNVRVVSNENEDAVYSGSMA